MKKLAFLVGILAMVSCTDENDTEPTVSDHKLIVKIKFNENQERLDNLGRPSTIPEENAAQTPQVNAFSAHYIELTPDALTLLGDGEILYKGEETDAGSETAIDFSKATLVEDDEIFLEIPINEIQPNTYEWVRISASYQNGTIQFLNDGNEYTGTIASFLGYNNYIGSFDINGQTIDVNANKLQGFWAFEAEGIVLSGHAPEGTVTVPNPLFETSPIPQGSCVLTGKFDQPLQISGKETKDITVTLSFSINNSFEWTEINKDGKYEPSAGETLVDMGLRGLKVSSN